MTAPEHIQATGIYVDEETQCFEAWFVTVDGATKALVATCSTGVSTEAYQWWEHQVWSAWMPEYGVEPVPAQVA